MEIQYDRYGRIAYTPELHPNHRKPYSEDDLEYLCKYWDVDDKKSLSYALGRPEATLISKVYLLKKDGLFDFYKNRNKHW